MEKQKIKEKVDSLIDKMNQICKMQKEIGLSAIDDFRVILVYKVDVLLQYADILNCNLEKIDYKNEEGYVSVSFKYRGYIFKTYIKQEKYDSIKEKVLPPTKVTEPIRENE